MYLSIHSYALWGEAAIAAYEAGEVAEYDGNTSAHQVCRRFADAIANSLRAMLASSGAPFDPVSCNLARYLGEFERSGVELPDGCASHARLAMRSLVLTAAEVHGDLLSADLYHEEDIAEAKEAAKAVCDWMCGSLLGFSLETVQLRFYKVHDNPLSSAEFWSRRRVARIRGAQCERTAAAATTSDTVAAGEEV